jgi:hypothetical protein
MRRRTQKGVIQFCVFLFLLSLILFVNRPQFNKTFAWTKVRYKTAATTLPEARGICPGLEKSSKPALVVSRVVADGDVKWLDVLAKKYHLCVYTADAPVDKASSHLQVPENRGHEAMAYMTFLIDNYDHIPAAGVVFVHGSRWAWHNDAPDYDNRALLLALDIPAALTPSGYHNLRCDWSITSCIPSSPPQGSLETSLQSVMSPFDTRTLSDSLLPGALAAIFGGTGELAAEGKVHLGRTLGVRTQCCAQFVVARENIWQHSRDEYVALRQWLLDGSSNSKDTQRGISAPSDDRVAGKILSNVWHILFIKHSSSVSGLDLGQLNEQACPSAEACYCRLYGHCDLDCSAGSCRGQYTLPNKMRLPDNWAATHP